jgi:hypothetical protein
MKTINLRTAALVIASLGLLALARAVTFDTAPEDTHNIGLMQVQMLWAQFASTMLLVGAVLFVGDRIVEAGQAAADLGSR